MSRKQIRILLVVILIAVIYFIAFIFPNQAGSENLAMVQMFQPDESTPLPSVFNMISPGNSLYQSLKNFVFYEYYFYGFPYFSVSALVLLPLHWLGQIGNIPLVMTLLRQMVSVLPLLGGLLLLVHMQDEFRTYRSPVLFLLLLSIPAVTQNNLWWHPDGVTFFFVVLTLFFLKRDNLEIKWNFVFAAITCGIAIATKLVGVYFFLAVGLTMLLAFLLKKVSWKRLLIMGMVFIVVMIISFLASNPFLLSGWARTSYLNIFRMQTDLLSSGYGVVYEKGITAAWPQMKSSFGSIFFLLLAIGAAIWGAWRGPRRFLNGLILAWFIPLTITVLWVSHFKFQYWMPAALPLFSCLVILLPENFPNLKIHTKPGLMKILAIIPPIILIVQFIIFLGKDFQLYTTSLSRAENNERIVFYDQVLGALQPLNGQSLKVYYDYRLYMPDTSGWTTETTYNLLDYSYIQEENFDVILLLDQRIKDYLDPDAEGIDQESFLLNQIFYRDADNETIDGFHMVYRNNVGLVFVKEDIYEQNFLDH